MPVVANETAPGKVFGDAGPSGDMLEVGINPEFPKYKTGWGPNKTKHKRAKGFLSFTSLVRSTRS